MPYIPPPPDTIKVQSSAWFPLDPGPPTADELKRAVRGVRNVLERLPENAHTKAAHEHLEKCADAGLRGVEGQPAGFVGGEVYP